MTATVTYNGLSLDEDPYHIVTVEGLADLPAIRSGDTGRVARGGLVAGRDLYGGRSVTITLDVLADTQAAFGVAVAALSRAFAAPVDDPLPLSFTIPGVADGVAARVYVRPRKRALPIATSWFQGTTRASVQLDAADPLLYSDSESSLTIAAAVEAGGRSYDRTYDMTYGSLGTGGIGIVSNLGDTPAPVVLRIYGPIVDPRVTNTTTGQVLGLTATLGGGEFVDIDTADRTVLLGGTADRYSWLTTPQWWDLQPGSNEISFTGSVSSGATVQVTYRSAWI